MQKYKESCVMLVHCIDRPLIVYEMPEAHYFSVLQFPNIPNTRCKILPVSLHVPAYVP